jgi:hypothetical protein
MCTRLRKGSIKSHAVVLSSHAVVVVLLVSSSCFNEAYFLQTNYQIMHELVSLSSSVVHIVVSCRSFNNLAGYGRLPAIQPHMDGPVHVYIHKCTVGCYRCHNSNVSPTELAFVLPFNKFCQQAKMALAERGADHQLAKLCSSDANQHSV